MHSRHAARFVAIAHSSALGVRDQSRETGHRAND
jgi:hypothetical protein